MDIPSIPTDNLYKFLALSGLVLCIILFISNIFIKQNLELKIAEAKGIIRTAELEKERLQIAGLSIAKFDHKDSVVVKRIFRHLDQVEESRKAVEILIVLAQQHNRQKIIFHTGFPITCLLTVIGFTLWYFKLQRYQDEKLILGRGGARVGPR